MADALPHVSAERRQGTSLLLVTRRFWPHANDGIGRLALLAEGLRRSGLRVTILAARFAASWPTELSFREIPVLRPVAAPRGDWSGALYARGLQRWLRTHGAQFDLLYSDNMREEGAVVVEAAKSLDRPSIVRCSGSGSNSDDAWASQSRGGRKLFKAAMQADAIVAPFASSARTLISVGARRETIQRIDDGIPATNRVDEQAMFDARAALAAVNHDLRVPRESQVILVTTPFTLDGNVLPIVDCIPRLADKYQQLRFWLVGDGPLREVIHERLRHCGVRDITALPGSFGHIDELWAAANLFIAPTDSDGLEHRLPSALGAGLPVLAVDSPEIRATLGPLASQIAYYSATESRSFFQQISAILDHYPEAIRTAQEMRSALRRHFPREHSIDAHQQLILQVLRRRQLSAPDTPSGAMP